MSDCLPVHARTSVCARVRVCLSVCLSVCLPACRAVGRSVGRSVGLSVCLSVRRFLARDAHSQRFVRTSFYQLCGRDDRHVMQSPARRGIVF